jgi:hypothetical protein
MKAKTTKSKTVKTVLCNECGYLKVCNTLLYTQVRLGIITCHQGRKIPVMKKKPVVKQAKEPRNPKPATAPMDVKDVQIPLSKKVNDAPARSDNPLA